MRQEKFLVTLCSLLSFSLCPAITLAASAPDLNELITPPVTVTATASAAAAPKTLYYDFNDFNNLIRDNLINKTSARRELIVRLAAIRADYYQRGGINYSSAEWIFPVAGYNVGAIDRGHSHGFAPDGYDFFTGNRHGGHPAYDIFIRDRNQDNRDDRSGKAVEVLAMTGGVVVALEKEWRQGSALRGGKYLWVYDPAAELLVYYAHNEELFVELGTVIKPGDRLATVGRSGLNAAKRRSPTHLHFSVLQVRNGQPIPMKVYRELQKAGSSYSQS